MGRRRATLKDIAETTGFSANTVSLALRGSPRLPEETRKLIRETAKRLNYAPNRIAQSLSSKATRTIGMLMTDIMNPTLTLAAQTIERELSRKNYAVMFAASGGDLEREKNAVRHFVSYQVDGMVVYPARRNVVEHFEQIDAAGTPVLALVDVAGAALDTVTIDDRIGAYKAMRHLIELGHRDFAMIDRSKALGNLDKMRGAQDALREASISADALTVLEPDGHSAAQGYALMDRLFATKARPSAIFASTDSLAIGVLHWCREHGVSIPNDISIVGYDDTDYAAFCAPPLTTVRYSADKISAIGVSRLLARLEARDGWSGPDVQLIEPELVTRGTTGSLFGRNS